jgi:protease-4
MTKEAVHKIAQGRVWSGVEAKEIGLVDQLGGLDVALERAATLAELDSYKITTYPKYEDDFDSLLEELFDGPLGAIKQKLPPELNLWLQTTEKATNPIQYIQTRLPYALNVN